MLIYFTRIQVLVSKIYLERRIAKGIRSCEFSTNLVFFWFVKFGLLCVDKVGLNPLEAKLDLVKVR